MILMTVIPNRRETNKRNVCKFNSRDKIMTVGGIIGTIVAIDSDTERYTINVGTAESESLMVIVKAQ